MLISRDSLTKCAIFSSHLLVLAAHPHHAQAGEQALCENAASAIAATVDGRKAGMTLPDTISAIEATSYPEVEITAFITDEIRNFYSETTTMPTDEMHAQQRRAIEIGSLMRCYRQFGTN